jgi:hypothetical protein
VSSRGCSFLWLVAGEWKSGKWVNGLMSEERRFPRPSKLSRGFGTGSPKEGRGAPFISPPAGGGRFRRDCSFRVVGVTGCRLQSQSQWQFSVTVVGACSLGLKAARRDELVGRGFGVLYSMFPISISLFCFFRE